MGWEEAIGGAVSGLFGLGGQMAAGSSAIDAARETNAFNREEAEKSRQYQTDMFGKTTAENRWLQSDSQAFNSREAGISREFSAGEAEKNRQYQTEMSNSAYQRSIEDLKKAGLNPMLAYTNGGASSPSGSMGQSSQASSGMSHSSAPSGAQAHGVMDNRSNHIGNMISEAVNTAKALPEVKLIKAREKTEQTMQKKNQEMQKNIELDNAMKKIAMPAWSSAKEVEEKQNKINSKPWAVWYDAISRRLPSPLSLVGSALGLNKLIAKGE